MADPSKVELAVAQQVGGSSSSSAPMPVVVTQTQQNPEEQSVGAGDFITSQLGGNHNLLDEVKLSAHDDEVTPCDDGVIADLSQADMSFDTKMIKTA